MILVFIFLSLLFLLSSMVLIALLSSVKIRIINLKFINGHIDKDYKLKVEMYLLNKIRILSFRIEDDNKNNIIKKLIKKINIKNKLNSLNFKKIKDNLSLKDMINIIKRSSVGIEKLKLYMAFGVGDVICTSYLVGIIASFIGIIIPHVLINDDVNEKNKDNRDNRINYNIYPIYNDKKIFIDLESIISFKIVHIILIIYEIIKKGRDNNGRTSNRINYVCSHGLY